MSVSQVDPAELHFLILHYLASGPCGAAARLFEQQALEHHLLPSRHDVLGNEHKLAYSDLQHKYAHISHAALPDLLQHALTAHQSSTPLNLQGNRSLLASGAAAAAPMQKPEAVSLHHKLALQQQGSSPRQCAGHRIASSAQHASRMQHHKTVRGHKLAVYCIAFDRTGRHIITGSDDRLVKIWSTQTAQLLRSCRGHDGEVTDLAVNLNSTVVASSSNDTTIRCWSLQRDDLGHPLSVLLGHEGPVTYVDFNKVVPNALVSSSYDGTCRIWDATNSSWPSKVMRASAMFGPMKGVTRFGGTAGPFNTGQGNKPVTRHEAAEATTAEASTTVQQEQPAGNPGLLVCGFSPDGTHIVAGSNDCHIYAWFWDIASAMDKGKGAAKQATYNVADEDEAARNLAPGRMPVPAGEDWPEVQEVCRLGGHVNDVLLLQFSHDGQSIATGSKDATVRKVGTALPKHMHAAWPLKCIPQGSTKQLVQTWQRMRRRHKVMHTWENKHVLKCELDDAVVRKARQRRRAPPLPSVNQLAWSFDDMMVVSSVSDHTIRVWDAETGQEVQRLVGHQAPVHILECHPLHNRLAMSASYDGTTRLWNLQTGKMLRSFSTQNTRPDIHGSWTDHIQLVDGHWSPNGNSLVVSDVAGQWHVYSLGPPNLVRHARYDQFLESDYDRLTRDLNNAVIDDNTQLPPHLRPTRDYLVDYMQVRYAEPYQTAYRSDRVFSLPLGVAQGQGEWDTSGLPQALREYPPTITAAGWVAQEAEGSDEDIDRAIQRALQRAIAAEASLAAAVVAGEVAVIAVDSEQEANAPEAVAAEEAAVAVRSGANARRSMPRQSDDDAEGDNDDAEEWQQWPEEDAEISSSDEDKEVSDSGDSLYEQAGAGPRTRAQRRTRRKGKRQRASPDRGQEHDRKRRRLRRAALLSSNLDHDVDELEEVEHLLNGQADARQEELSEDEDLPRGTRLRRKAAPSFGTDRRGKNQKKKVARRQTGKGQTGSGSQGPRQLENYAWLQVGWRVPGVYVPQLGDEVVYLTVGHQKFWSATNNKLQGPWDCVLSSQTETEQQVSMREVEPAVVIALDYSISNDGTSNTCARVELQLTAPDSPLLGRTFQVELPPPNCGHAEFVIPRHRFLTSVHKRWIHPAECQAFYPVDEEAAAICEAWKGVITNIPSQQQADQIQADPFGCSGLWELYQVQWQADPQDNEAAGSSGNNEEAQPSLQSPWELFDADLDPQQAAQEGPQLDPVTAGRLTRAVDILMAWEQFEVFVDLLDPDAAYPTDSGALLFYNSTVALPISLSLIKIRLEQSYYRQTAGFLGDIDTLANNAKDFNGEDSPVGLAAADLAQRFRAAAAGKQYDEGSESEDAEISDVSGGPADEGQDDIDIMNSPGSSNREPDRLQPWARQGSASRRSQRNWKPFGSPVPADSTAVLRGPDDAFQEGAHANGPVTDAQYTSDDDDIKHDAGPSNHQAAWLQQPDDHMYSRRQTRSRQHVAPQDSDGVPSPPTGRGRRSARLQVKDDHKPDTVDQHTVPILTRNSAADRASRALARASRQVTEPRAVSSADMNADEQQSSDEGVHVEDAGPSVAARTTRRTRDQYRHNMPESSKHSTPEPPERLSDVHNTGHALRRSTRQHARSPSVAGPAAAIVELPEAPPVAPSGIRVTLRPLRQAHTQQQQSVRSEPGTGPAAATGRHSLRSGLRSRH